MRIRDDREIERLQISRLWCKTGKLLLGTVGDAIIMITGVVLIVMLR